MPTKRLLGVIGLIAVGLLIAAAATPLKAQTIKFGPGGVEVNPDNGQEQERREELDRRERNLEMREHQFDRDRHWAEVRDRLAGYRDACRDGDRRACVRLGIIIGQNQERRGQWQREHPDYFWWERD
jgi:hypothetical protein